MGQGLHVWLYTGCVTLAGFYSLYLSLHRGDLLDDDMFISLTQCRREEPDLALLYHVNERFLLWKVVQKSFVETYIQYGWGISDKESYTPLPNIEELQGTLGERCQSLDEQLDEQRKEWVKWA